jgi:hypothetical protein
MNKKTACFCSVTLIAGGVWAQSQPATPSAPKSGEPEKNHATQLTNEAASSSAGSQQPPVVIKNIFKPEIANESHGVEKKSEDSKGGWDAIVAIATIILAFITWWLAYYTRGLWGATVDLSRDAKETSQQQARDTLRSLELAEAANIIAREEFQYVHRPRLLIRRETVRFFPKDNGINLVLANVGQLPADKIICNVNIKIISQDELESFTAESLPPYGTIIRDISGIRAERSTDHSPALGGEESMYLYFISEEITETTMEHIHNGRLFLLFFGYLEFFGPDGVRRRSAFYRKFDHVRHGFVPSEDPDYEHH